MPMAVVVDGYTFEHHETSNGIIVRDHAGQVIDASSHPFTDDLYRPVTAERLEGWGRWWLVRNRELTIGRDVASVRWGMVGRVETRYRPVTYGARRCMVDTDPWIVDEMEDDHADTDT